MENIHKAHIANKTGQFYRMLTNQDRKEIQAKILISPKDNSKT